MYQAAPSKKALKGKLDYLKARVGEMEKGWGAIDQYGQKRDFSIIPKYIAFQKLSPAQKQQINDDWEGYYDVVQHTRAYERFYEQRQAFLDGRIDEVKRLSAEARTERETKTDWVKRPSSVNPDFFENDSVCIEYRRVLGQIADITKTLKEMGDSEALADNYFDE